MEPPAQQGGHRKVRQDDVATLQSRAAVQGNLAEQVTERRIRAPRREQSDHQHHEVKDEVAVLALPSPACQLGEEGERRDQRQQAGVAGHLGQVVVGEEVGLTARTVPPEDVRHEEQRRPAHHQRARPEVAVADRRTLREADEGPPGQELHQPNGAPPRQAGRQGDHVGDASAPRLNPVRASNQQDRRTERQAQQFDLGDAARFARQKRQTPQQRVAPNPGLGNPRVVTPRARRRLERESTRERDQDQCGPRNEGEALDAAQVDQLSDHGARVGEAHRRGEGRQRAQSVPTQQGEHSASGDQVDGNAVDDPGGDRGHEGEDHRERIQRPGVESPEQWRTGVRERIEQRQMARRDLLAAQDAQRKVLNQIVAVNRRMAQERRDNEEQRRHYQHREDGASISAGTRPPPPLLMRGGDETHGLHATKKHDARATRSRGPYNTGVEGLSAARSRTATCAVAINEGRTTGA